MAWKQTIKADVKRVWGGRITRRVMLAGSFGTVAAAAIVIYATFQLFTPVQSYPIVGGVWQADFNVYSTVLTDLTISFVKPTTRDDLNFVGLFCNDVEVPFYGRRSGVTWYGSNAYVYYYKWYNYQCDGITSWRVKVLTAGKHHQRIQFGRIRQDIYNEARSGDYDDFEDGEITSNPAWSTAGTGSVTIEAAAAKNGSYGMNVDDVTGKYIDYGIGSLSLATLDTWTWIRTTDVSGAFACWTYLQPGTGIIGGICLDSSKFQYRLSTGYFSVVDVSPNNNTWYAFRTAYDGTKVNFYIYNDSYDVIDDNINITPGNTGDVGIVQVFVQNNNGDVHFDDVGYGDSGPPAAPPSDPLPPTVHIFLPLDNQWYEGTVNIDVNVWDDNAVISAWVDSNVSSDCFADQNVTLGDNNLTWDSTDVDCASVFDVNIIGYAFDYNFSNPAGTHSVVAKIDNLKPFTYWDGNHNVWQTTDANVHLTCDDGTGSGCVSTKYRLDIDSNSEITYGSWQAYDGNVGVVISVDGNYVIDFNSTDYIGNVGDVNTFYILIDSVSPEVSIRLPQDGNLHYDSNIVAFDLNDSSSGIDTATVEVLLSYLPDINGEASTDFVFGTHCTLNDTNYICVYEESVFDTNGADYNVTVIADDVIGYNARDTVEFRWLATPSVLWGNVNDFYLSDASGIDLYPSSLRDQNITPFGQNDLNGIFNVTNNSNDAFDVNVFVDLNLALPNDSNLTVCRQKDRVANDTILCFDVNTSSEARIADELSYDANQMLWWFFDLNLVGIPGYDFALDYEYRVSFSA